LPVINRVSEEGEVEIDPPPPIDLARTEYTNPIIPFVPEAPKPRHNTAIRVIGAPFRGIRAIVRKIEASGRETNGM
jgi:hypothetical protein